MSETLQIGRRAAIRAAAASFGVVAAEAAGLTDPAKIARRPAMDFAGLHIGLASFSTRKLTVDQTIEVCRRTGMKHVSLKDVHLSRKSSPDERKAVRQKFTDAGIRLENCGVMYLKNDEADIRGAFEYARDLGTPGAVVAIDQKTVPLLEKVLKDFDMKASIHNHGPEDKLGAYSPLDVMAWLKGTSPKIGLCVDVGHTFRCGVDPAAAIRKCAARVYDIHFKDLADTTLKAKGTAVGQGVLDVTSILKTLAKMRFTGHVALEYEEEEANPVPGIGESIGFARGVLRS